MIANRLVIVSALVLVCLVLASFAYSSYSPGGAATSSGSSVSSTPSPGVTSSTAAMNQGCASGDWTTYHGNNSRTGFSPLPATTASAGWKSPELDGRIYAEPVVCGQSIVVATENDSVYSLDSGTGTVLWRAHLGTPMRSSALPCGDIDPSGITGTPVVDPKTDLVYVVAFETPGVHELVALDLKDGGVRFRQLADPPGANPLVEQERGALSLEDGRVYVPYGGLFGDCGDYHGWVVGLNADGSGGLVSYRVQSSREAGIWAPSGAAIDSSGHLFVTTGNGASDSQFDYGNSVIELSPTLQQLGYFAPADWVRLNQGDTDLGSFGPLLLGNGEIFQTGKDGMGYLLNATDLGGIGGQIFSASVCGSSFGAGAEAGNLVFVPCINGLFALGFSQRSFRAAWHTPAFPAGPPVVTGGIVWTLDTSAGVMHGYSVSGGSEMYAFDTGQVTRFTTPSFGDGQAFVAAGSQVLAFPIG